MCSQCARWTTTYHRFTVVGLPTPRIPSDTQELRALARRLVPDEVPVILDVEHPPGAKPRDCTANVERVIDVHGGEMQLGWLLWEMLPGVMIEAEFHAVWVDPRGNLRDVTPRALGAGKSAFLPDPTLVYEGRQINNVRVALVDDALLREYIGVADAYFEATNRGALADYHGPLRLTAEMQALRQRQLELQIAILTKYFG